MTGFSLAMVLRESRSAWKRLILFVVSIAVGVGGLVAVKSFSYGLETAIRSEARTLMASDLSFRSHRELTPEENDALKDLERGGALVDRGIGFSAMGTSPNNREVHLVQVRGVGERYPFYGEVVTGSGEPLMELLNDDTVMVQPSLLIRFRLSVGDELRLGKKTFRIAGTVVSEPDRPVQVFSLGPNVMLTVKGAEATGLIGPRSHAHFTALVKLPQGQDAAEVVNRLKEKLPDRFASIRTYDESQPSIRRFLGQLTNYLNLVGLAALILGGIGVAGAVRVFLGQKLDTLAILKCLGATSGTLIGIYLSLSLLLGLAGSLAGAVLGLAAQTILAGLMSDFLPVSFQFSMAWRGVAEGVGLGLLTTLWFALPPLWQIRSIPPALVFRRQVESPTMTGQRWRSALVTLGSALLLVTGLVIWQVGWGRIAAISLAGLVGTFVALQIAAAGLLFLARRIPKPGSFALRQGLSSLYRPGNQTAAVMVSLGLGVLLVLAVFLIQTDMIRQVAEGSTREQPNLFFMDIQKGQEETFANVMAKYGVDNPEMVPLVRGRLQELQGQELRLDKIEDPQLRRVLGFEYAVTYRADLIPGETVLEGKFQVDPNISGAQVSVANWWLEATESKIGDTVTLNIQGVPIRATITSVRSIDWTSRRTNFSFVFLPGALEDAPHSFLAAVNVSGGEQNSVEAQRAVVEAIPNVSVIDLAVMMKLLQGIIDRIALVVQFMAGFSVSVGLVTLLGTIATTKFQRVREAVLYKTLGATRWATARVLATEYVLLGLFAGLVGSMAAGVLSWGLVTQVFDGVWELDLAPYLVAWAVTTGLILVAGLGSSFDVLMRKPLQVLREE